MESTEILVSESVTVTGGEAQSEKTGENFAGERERARVNACVEVEEWLGKILMNYLGRTGNSKF